VSLEAFAALSPAERAESLSAARGALLAAGADIVLDSVASLVPALIAHSD
jgi:hypothetical protein